MISDPDYYQFINSNSSLNSIEFIQSINKSNSDFSRYFNPFSFLLDSILPTQELTNISNHIFNHSVLKNFLFTYIQNNSFLDSFHYKNNISDSLLLLNKFDRLPITYNHIPFNHSLLNNLLINFTSLHNHNLNPNSSDYLKNTISSFLNIQPANLHISELLNLYFINKKDSNVEFINQQLIKIIPLISPNNAIFDQHKYDKKILFHNHLLNLVLTSNSVEFIQHILSISNFDFHQFKSLSFQKNNKSYYSNQSLQYIHSLTPQLIYILQEKNLLNSSITSSTNNQTKINKI